VTAAFKLWNPLGWFVRIPRKARRRTRREILVDIHRVIAKAQIRSGDPVAQACALSSIASIVRAELGR
jgi:hypothetical protein